MKNRIKNLIQKAIYDVEGLESCLHEMEQNMLINQLSESTTHSYCCKIAEICRYHKKLPGNLSESEINDFLTFKIENAKGFSNSEFKHVVYSLRYYYKMKGRDDLRFKLPSKKKTNDCL